MSDRYTALAGLIEDYRHRPFKWGSVDCMQITIDWLFRATGVQHYPDLKKYTTARGAMKVLKGLGYDSLEAAVDAHFERREPAYAQRGDLVSFQSTQSDKFPVAIGVCCGSESAFPVKGGLVFHPNAQCLTFWKID